MASLYTEVDSGASGSAIWKTRSVGAERIAGAAISWSITVNVVASMGIFNAGLLPAELSFSAAGHSHSDVGCPDLR
ncbi:hypothetical protein ACVWW5_005427 [Bradyrhizobium sp. LM3.4]